MTHSSSPWDRYLNPQETQAYGQLFKLASQSKPGIVTGSEAVQFFASSGVPNEILSDVSKTASSVVGTSLLTDLIHGRFGKRLTGIMWAT